MTRITEWMAGRSTLVLAGAIAMTALLAIPFLTMEPDESASQEPTGEVFDARDLIEDRFASSVFGTFFVAEAVDGDILTADALRDLLAAEEALRNDPEIGPSLFTYFDADDEASVVGAWTIADRVNHRLPGGLAAAGDREVKEVATQLLNELGGLQLGLSAETTIDESTGLAVSPGLTFPILSDDTLLGFGTGAVRIGGDTESEEYSRDIQEILRQGTTYEIWGIAIDVNLTSAEQGQEAGPFIGFTILAVLIIVGVTFRSYWVVAVTGAALAALIIWLQGLSNLVGLEDDLVLTLIVPIAMISFGVDFAFHAVGRYREMTQDGHRPRRAFTVGITAVSGALVLALASDSAAFLSNTSAGIESIVQFGVGAAIALVAAFLLLGLVTPLAVSVIEDRTGIRAMGWRAWLGAAGAGSLAMTSVLMSVFILPLGGVIALAVYLAIALWLPARLAKPSAEGIEARPPGRPTKLIGNAISAVTRRRAIVLPVVGLITVGATLLAVQVETEFDVKDFFASDSDFVVGLDKLDVHGGEQQGEPAEIYIEADLADPAVMAALARFVDDFETLDSNRFGRDENGIAVLPGVVGVIEDVWSSQVAQGAIAQLSGVTLTDEDGDGIPDTRQQLEALYAVTSEIGVPFDLENLIRTPDGVRTVLFVDGEAMATQMAVGIPGSRQVESITAARLDADPLMASFESELTQLDPDALVVLTGGPITRQESLDAISRALQVSLPIAVFVCFLIAAVFMRSARFGAVVVIPILIVVSWLYGFMYLFGFAINLVTATIGAVSIGIGIDFAIHFAVRYREELEANGSREHAVQAAGEGTGVALVASAASSIAGFAILALAPMPLFASYGFLTAVMIAMALAASLLVLPALLMLITSDRTPVSEAEPTAVPALTNRPNSLSSWR